MNPFQYQRATSPDEALHAVSTRGAKFLGGGTNLVDLMKYHVESPTTLIDITHISFTQIARNGSTTMIGAGVRNSDVANHEIIRTNYPLLSQALLSGASPQLRNMATTGGNLMQRTRCYYFMDTTFPACNKRIPGSGCAAIEGFNRNHAILGASGGSDGHDECIATNPSDMNVALASLNATIHVTGPKGKRTIPIADFHRLPGNTPNVDTNLNADELITAVELPAPKFAKHSYYLKVRDRQSYAFALVSVAAGLEMSGNTIQSAGLALGGVAHKPWRSLDAEKSLVGAPANTETFKRAADFALSGAVAQKHNAFKIELAKQSIVRALTLAAQGVQA
jgi:xanthine dehydrogenase YagS FAD-binding subunit